VRAARISVLITTAAIATLGSNAQGAHERLVSGRWTGSAGVEVRLPSGWHFYRDGVAPRSMPYADPLVRVVVASANVRAYPHGCKAETFRFARKSIGLMIVEWVHPQPGVVWPSKPRRFTTRTLPVQRQHAVECWPGQGGSTQFVFHGRRFGAYLLLGPDAAPVAASKARAVLDTLRIK
jgi:hypothetical protein